MKKINTIDEYISSSPDEVQPLLKKIRKEIKATVPKQTVEAIKYGIPTFILNGVNLIHFGGWKNHIGFYPIPSAIQAFKKELSKYESAKGSIKFPLDNTFPFPLIKKIVKFRIKEVLKNK